MSPYMKRFVYMSLLYLAFAALFGILSATTDLGYAAAFAHSHFNLLGFMAMIVFGIGYFILPRFNGTDLRWPGWVPVHFWLGNASLIGLILFRGLYSVDGHDLWHTLFIIASVVQVLSLSMFVVNIWVTLSTRKKPAHSPAPSSPAPRHTAAANPVTPATLATVPATPAAAPSTVLDADTKISDLVDLCPSIRETLVEQGLKMLSVPGHLDKVRKVGVTLGMAAANHGLDLDTLIVAVQTELKRSASPTPSSASPNPSWASPNPSWASPNPSSTSPSLSSSSSSLRGREAAEAISAPIAIDSETLIGTVLERYPQTNVIFQRYFGDGCLDCPGQTYESIDLACRIHGVDPEIFIEELHAAARG